MEKSGLLSWRVCKCTAISDLRQEGTASDLRPTKIGPLEAVEIRAAGFHLLFEFGRMHHQSNGLLMVNIMRFRRKSLERSLGLLQSTFTDKEPRRFRTEEQSDEERDWPDPLYGKGDPVAPLGMVVH